MLALLVWPVFGAVGSFGMWQLARWMDRKGYGDE